MSRFEVFTGPPGRSVLIGLVDAANARAAVEALNHRRRSPGAVEGHSVGTAYIEWAHPDLHRVAGSQTSLWRAVPANGPQPARIEER